MHANMHVCHDSRINLSRRTKVMSVGRKRRHAKGEGRGAGEYSQHTMHTLHVIYAKEMKI